MMHPAHGWIGPLVVASLLALPMMLSAQQATDQPFVVEYYYKAKWGHQQEFMDLFRKNHLPILLKEKEQGRLLEVTLATPRYHGTEDGRWDYRVTLTFKDLAAAFGQGALSPDEIRKMYPDQATFAKEEARRFEILDAHWDVAITTGPMRQ